MLRRLLVNTGRFIVGLLGFAVPLVAYTFAELCFIMQGLQDKKRRDKK